MNPCLGGAGGWPSPDAFFSLGSDEAEDPGIPDPRLQSSADALRGVPGKDGSGAWRGVCSCHPHPRAGLWETQESKLCCLRTPCLPGLCGGGAFAAGAGRGWRSAFPEVSPWHIWPTCGSHYRSQGLCAAIFTHRMKGGGGRGRLLRTPAGRRGPGSGWVRPCLRPDSGIQLCARGPGGPALQSPGPSLLAPLSVSSGLTETHLHSGTRGYTGAESTLASRSAWRARVCVCTHTRERLQ